MGPGLSPFSLFPGPVMQQPPCYVPGKILGNMQKKAGFELVYSEDKTKNAALWWEKVNAIKKAKGTGPLNPSLVFGENAGCFGANMERNFKEQAVLCVENIWVKIHFFLNKICLTHILQ